MTRPANSADPHLEPAEIGDVLDLLAEPAPHLRAGIAGRNPVDVELLVEVVHQLHAAAEIHPGGLHAAVEPERHRGAQGECRILAEVIVRRGVAHLDRAVLHGIGGLQARHDLARSEDLNLEPVVARFSHRLGEGFRRAVNGVERLREARGQPPLELGHGLRDCGPGDGGRRCSQPGGLKEMTTFHGESLLHLSVVHTAAAARPRSQRKSGLPKRGRPGSTERATVRWPAGLPRLHVRVRVRIMNPS